MEEVVVVEQTIDEDIRSTYEIEREKPVSSFNHNKIQARTSQQLLNQCEEQVDVLSELSLEAPNLPSVADLSIFQRNLLIG